MYPLIVPSRATSLEGLWIPKTYGSFEDGNAKDSNYTITGDTEIKELGGRLKMFFHNIDLKVRKKPKTREEKAKEIMEAQEHKKKQEAGEEDAPDSDAESDNEHAEDQTAHHQAEEILNRLEKEAGHIVDENPLPRLQCYLTLKKPKPRMADIDRFGTRVFIQGSKEGLFGIEGSKGNFVCSLKDIPDPLTYEGLVVAKAPQDEPVTENWIVFSMMNLIPARDTKTVSLAGCGLDTINDVLDKATGGLEDSDGKKKKRKMSDNLKGMSYYRRQANKAWREYEIDPDDEVIFHDFLKLLDMQDLFMIHSQAKRAYHAVDVDGSGEVGLSEYENFLMAYDLLDSGKQDLVLLDIYDTFKGKPNHEYGNLSMHEGLDFSGFCEACHMLEVEKDEEDLMHAFMDTAKLKKPEQIPDRYLTHEEFKKAWLQVTDAIHELEKRGLKPEKGRFAIGRNRDRVYRYITDQETSYLSNLKKINNTVEKIKHDDRIKKEEKKKEKRAYQDGLSLQKDRFQAVRGLEKRLLMKKEQEERSKKRDNEKLLRNKMLQAKAANDKRKNDEIAGQTKAAEKLRSDEIRAKGWDRVDLSLQNLRLVPDVLYKGDAEQQILSYATILNLSSNHLDELPDSNFFYWLSGLRKLKLSFNRIRKLPVDIHKCTLIEVLEMEENRIVNLPSDIGVMKNLMRLEVANNQLEELPESLGECGQLIYISAHSNYIKHVPAQLGACFMLQYLDLARNKITELPEDYSHLQSLIHLDVASNRLGRLPYDIGDCRQLVHLNAAANLIAHIPESFSTLDKLQFCNLQNNNAVLSRNMFKQCSRLKTLMLDKNEIPRVYTDIEFCKELCLLDLNNNKLSHIPTELGLLPKLEKLRLSHNYLEEIPVEIGSLQCLLNLDMSCNKIIGSVPGPIGLLTSLRHLDLSFNEFDDIPRSLIGLSEIITIKFEKNKLFELPDTITHLDTLELLDISNNRFREFPIHLSNMRNLKQLNMSNNAMELLPRNMDSMSRLHQLNLSRNNLKAVPVEFASVFEGVPDVLLADNPWTLLPNRWGKLWPGKKQTEGPTGYAVAEAVDFLYGMRAIFDAAEQIWADHGVLYFTNRMTYQQYLHELRARIPHTWYEGLADRAKFLFFSAKENGNFPRWYTTTEDVRQEEEARRQYSQRQRDDNVIRARSEMSRKLEKMNAAYDPQMSMRKAVRRDEMLVEHSVNEEIAHSMGLIALHHSARQREHDAGKRLKERNRQLERKDKWEIKRLQEIIKLDQEHMI